MTEFYEVHALEIATWHTKIGHVGDVPWLPLPQYLGSYGKRGGSLTPLFLRPTREEVEMRKTVVLLASMAATLLLTGGVALALTKVGGPGHNVLYGTNNPDKIDGRAGDDIIHGLEHFSR